MKKLIEQIDSIKERAETLVSKQKLIELDYRKLISDCERKDSEIKDLKSVIESLSTKFCEVDYNYSQDMDRYSIMLTLTPDALFDKDGFQSGNHQDIIANMIGDRIASDIKNKVFVKKVSENKYRGGRY